MDDLLPIEGELLSTADTNGNGILRFLTCGSVDDGKSTLIGRLLFDTHLIYEDQLTALEATSKKSGTTGDDIDLALLLDGLQAEQEQGITIDVAYRFFSTPKRKFIVADTPGHEQYTRNMITGASNSSLAVILVDARKGILTQTRRHSFINALIGVKHVVLAVNKMDLVGFDEAVFQAIVDTYQTFADPLGFQTIQAIPMSARYGDNVASKSSNMDWYDGPTLQHHLEEIDVGLDDCAPSFRFPVQWVNRPDLSFRGFSGTVASGAARVGDEVVVAKSGEKARIHSIVTMDGNLDKAATGQAVTITLEDDIDISRGDILAAPEGRPLVTDQVTAHIIWMGTDPLFVGRPYWLKLGTQQVQATVTGIKHRVDVNDGSTHVAAKSLKINEIGLCNLSFAQGLAVDRYSENQRTGSFILIDRFSNQTIAAGMIAHGLRRAENLQWQSLDINKKVRAEQKAQVPRILWFTGLSGAGKSTIANLVEKKLQADGHHTYLLDGDNVRHGLNRDLGFTDADRVENIRRIGEVARLMLDAGLVVLVAAISPFESERRMVRELVEEGEFIEIFVDTPLSVCEERDTKGLYRKARNGEIPNLTGIQQSYEEPTQPDIHILTDKIAADAAAREIVSFLQAQSPDTK